MIHTVNDLSGDAVFQLRVRQAILAAQHTVKQVGLLLIDFDTAGEDSGILDSRREGLVEEAWIRLRGTLRESDTIVQMDSGDLAVLLPSVAGPDDVLLVARKLLNRLAEPFAVGDLRIEVEPRVGIALFPEHSSNANMLIQRADAALSAAKRTKTTYVVYAGSESNGQRPPLRMAELRHAIVADQLFLLYQPKIDLKTGLVCGVEVLSRWQHPQLGLIPPDEFIPVAERTGLIIPLTLWVLQQALLQCRAWNEAGVDLSVAVNLSMWNLEAAELPDQIKAMLADVGVKPESLELEITESAIMGDPQRVMRTLSAVRDLGVRFTIDDFGTGYSSLAHLKKLPVAGMKIDKSFVQNMESDRDNAVIVRSIVDLGHNLGLSVVAEGVETLEAKEMLASFRCDAGQGYYFSRPVPAQDVVRLMKLGKKLTAEKLVPPSLNGKAAGSRKPATRSLDIKTGMAG
ncbi:MAG TPA: GGDEF domain-containing phosphodiesterase [candidate division Zixibacteria bacterium]|nr:GGDEF domain-containing phosphodiesterase [candidate division Zixibacteria bacterium]